MEAGDHAGVCEALSGRLGTVLVRAGEQGSWFSDGGAARHTPSIPVTPVDTNGAGDAHSGVLAAALARGRRPEDGAALGECGRRLDHDALRPGHLPE